MDKISLTELKEIVVSNEKKIQELTIFNDGCKFHINEIEKKNKESVNLILKKADEKPVRRRSVDRHERNYKREKIEEPKYMENDTIIKNCVKCGHIMFIFPKQAEEYKKKGYVLPQVCCVCKKVQMDMRTRNS